MIKVVLDCKTVCILLRVDPVHAMKPCLWEQKYNTACSYPLRYMEVNGQLHTPTTLPPGKNSQRTGG